MINKKVKPGSPTLHSLWVLLVDQIGLIIKQVLPRSLVLKIPQDELRGNKWVVTSGVLEYYLGCFEPTKVKQIKAHVEEGKVFYDLGAHVGYFSLLAAALVKGSGRVISFEPNPENIRYLERHVSMNDYSNVKIVEAAISDVNGVARFNSEKESSKCNLSTDGDIQVVTRTIDALVETGEIPPPDYMKIDVEGSEFKALNGAHGTLEKYRPTMFVSTHGVQLKHECVELLHSLGYRVEPEKGTCLDDTTELLAYFE